MAAVLALAATALIGCVAPEATQAAPAGAQDAARVAAEEGRAVGHTELFADVPLPGYPEGITTHGDLVFVGTDGFTAGPTSQPSKLLVYDARTGALLREVVVQGQDLMMPHGLAGLTTDGLGRVYAASVQGPVYRFEADTLKQSTYAELPDLAPCLLSGPPCSPTLADRAGLSNDLMFDAEGNLFITDSAQATIWKVPPEGEPEIWFQHEVFDQVIGVNGIKLGPDGETLYISVTFRDLRAIYHPAVYTLPFVDDPDPEDLEVFHAYPELGSTLILGGPDGMVFGESGRLYVTLTDFTRQVSVLEPDGSEAFRFPDPVENTLAEHQYDSPTSIIFRPDSRSVLVPQQAFVTGYALPQQFKVLDSFVDDTPLPLAKPIVP